MLPIDRQRVGRVAGLVLAVPGIRNRPSLEPFGRTRPVLVVCRDGRSASSWQCCSSFRAQAVMPGVRSDDFGSRPLKGQTISTFGRTRVEDLPRPVSSRNRSPASADRSSISFVARGWHEHKNSMTSAPAYWQPSEVSVSRSGKALQPASLLQEDNGAGHPISPDSSRPGVPPQRLRTGVAATERR